MGVMKNKMRLPEKKLGRTGIEKAVELKEFLKRREKASMIADGVIEAKIREKLLGIDHVD